MLYDYIIYNKMWGPNIKKKRKKLHYIINNTIHNVRIFKNVFLFYLQNYNFIIL